MKGRTNLKINEKYLSPDAFGAPKCAGNQSAPSSKVLSPSRSNSSLSLYSSASAPSSPLARKVRCWGAPPGLLTPPSPRAAGADPSPPAQAVLRRTRSGDRCPRSRGSLLPDGAELPFAAETLALAPPGETPPLQGVPCPPRAACCGRHPSPHEAGGWGAGGGLGGLGEHGGAGGGGAAWGRAVGRPPVQGWAPRQPRRALAEPPEGSPPERCSPCR